MAERRTRHLAAVWFADVVGHTSLSAQDEDAALTVVDELQLGSPIRRDCDVKAKWSGCATHGVRSARTLS